MSRRPGLEIGQYRLVGVQGIEQPEQRHVGHGEVSHSLVTLTTHAHQPLTLGGQLGQQVVQLRQQPRVRRETEQRRYIVRIKAPGALPVTHQARDRAGQVIAVLVVIEAQAQHVFQYADRLHFIGVNVLHLTPVLAITGGSIGLVGVEQAVVAIGLLQWQGQEQGRRLGFAGQQARQLQTQGQSIDMVGVDQGAVWHAQAQASGLELAQAQCLQVKRDVLDAPGVHQGQTSQTLVGPGFPACLLLELLRRQQCPRGPQGAVDFHEVESLRNGLGLHRTQAFALGICETSDRLTSMPSTWKCGTAYNLTRKKPGLSSMSSTVTLPARNGCEACRSSPGSSISVTKPPTHLFSSNSSNRRSLVVPTFSRWISFR
ncbi:hypothetical protein D3C86_1287260 [compost metagenome]